MLIDMALPGSHSRPRVALGLDLWVCKDGAGAHDSSPRSQTQLLLCEQDTNTELCGADPLPAAKPSLAHAASPETRAPAVPRLPSTLTLLSKTRGNNSQGKQECHLLHSPAGPRAAGQPLACPHKAFAPVYTGTTAWKTHPHQH